MNGLRGIFRYDTPIFRGIFRERPCRKMHLQGQQKSVNAGFRKHHSLMHISIQSTALLMSWLCSGMALVFLLILSAWRSAFGLIVTV